VLSCTLALALPALTFALPKSTGAYLLGGKMIRSEIALKSADGVLHDFRIDRGRLLKRYAANALILAERDGTKATMRISSSARVILNGKPSNLRALRPRMQVAVPRDRDLPADIVYASSANAGTPKIPDATVLYLLGNRMMRAEIALKSADGVLHDYLLDRGRIKQASPYVLILRESDGTMVTINVSPAARVKLNGKIGSSAQLRKGMMATTMRDGDKPADQIWATRK
jgi:hypothetical protein